MAGGRGARGTQHKLRTNSSRPTGSYEAVCDVLHYLIYSKRNRTAKMKAPPHPPLPPAEAGKKRRNKPCSMEKLHGNFDQSEKRTITTATTIREILNENFLR